MLLAVFNLKGLYALDRLPAILKGRQLLWLPVYVQKDQDLLRRTAEVFNMRIYSCKAKKLRKCTPYEYVTVGRHVTGEKILITSGTAGKNPDRLRDRPTLYHVAIKAGLYRKAVQVHHIPITTI